MVEAAKWYRKAADQGDAISQYLIGACYDSGTGVPKDCVVAYKWILLAGGQGYELAKKGIDLMEARMTREQIAEGQKMAREFVPTKGGK
jgi:TPR repeat protein